MNLFHWYALGFLGLVVLFLVLAVLMESRRTASDSLVWAASILSVFCVVSLATAFLLEV